MLVIKEYNGIFLIKYIVTKISGLVLGLPIKFFYALNLVI